MLNFTISRTFAQQLTDALNEVNRKARDKTLQQADGYKEALKDLEHREDTIYDDRTKNVLDDEGYRRQLQRIRDERAYYTKLLTDSNLAIQDAFMEKAETILELAIDAKSHWESMSAEKRRTFLDKVASNPVLDSPTVRFELQKPFEWLIESPEKSNWRTRIDDLRTACIEYVA